MQSAHNEMAKLGAKCEQNHWKSLVARVACFTALDLRSSRRCNKQWQRWPSLISIFIFFSFVSFSFVGIDFTRSFQQVKHCISHQLNNTAGAKNENRTKNGTIFCNPHTPQAGHAVAAMSVHRSSNTAVATTRKLSINPLFSTFRAILLFGRSKLDVLRIHLLVTTRQRLDAGGTNGTHLLPIRQSNEL